MTTQKVTRKDVLFISISIFVLTFAWVAFSLYHRWVTTTITPELQQQIQQIDPNFDTQTITELKGREKISPDYNVNDGTIISPTIALTLTPPPITSVSAILPSPSLTQGANQP
jgi:hypothetical protein